MIRTQVTLTAAQYHALKDRAAATHTSIAALVRRAVDDHLAHDELDDRIRRALLCAGIGESGLHDVSAQHDDYLAEAFDHR